MMSNFSLTVANIRSFMQSIWQQALSMTQLTATGKLKRQGTVWYIDIQYNAPTPSTDSLRVDTVPTSSLRSQFDNVALQSQNLQANSTNNLKALERRLLALEAAVAIARSKLEP